MRSVGQLPVSENGRAAHSNGLLELVGSPVTWTWGQSIASKNLDMDWTGPSLDLELQQSRRHAACAM
jgi:hypothetical protein